MTDFYRKLVELLEDGERVAVASIIASQGSTPRKAGARMMVLESGRTHFSVGGGPFEAAVTKAAMEALASGHGGARRYDFTREGENATGTTCGGSAEVLIEVHEPEACLLVFGGGHVGQALVRLARGVGYRAVVVDDRAAYADPARFPEGVESLQRDFRDPKDLPRVDGRTFVVIVTRCHETDRRVLEALAGAAPAYLAMVGSRRKWSVMREELEEAGIDPDWLDGIHVPAGLDLGGETPGEIALEILAEVVRTRNRPDEPPERPARALRAIKGRKG